MNEPTGEDGTPSEPTPHNEEGTSPGPPPSDRPRFLRGEIAPRPQKIRGPQKPSRIRKSDPWERGAIRRSLGRVTGKAKSKARDLAVPQGSAREQALLKANRAMRWGLAGWRAGRKLQQKTFKIVKRLALSGPPGWIALALLLVAGVVVWLVFYFNATAGNFASQRAEDKPDTVHEGLTADIPPEYLRLYQTAGDRWDLPWQVLASWGDLATDHGRYSPYDCVQRLDPESGLAYTYYLDIAHGTWNSYIDELHAGRIHARNGWMPNVEHDSDGDTIYGDDCGPYGWQHQWCPAYTGLSPLAPDPPIAPQGGWYQRAQTSEDLADINEGAEYIPFRFGLEGYDYSVGEDRFGTSFLVCSESSNIPTDIKFVSHSGLCGPMLLSPSKARVPCDELQNPAVAIDVVAQVLSDNIDSHGHTAARALADLPATGMMAYLFENIVPPALFEDEESGLEEYAQSPVDVPYSFTQEHGDKLRSSAELFPHYWAYMLEMTVFHISSPEMGQQPNCAWSTGKHVALRPGDPSSFSYRSYCLLAIMSAPAYHDWRLGGYANEGIATGKLAANLWARDLLRISWSWNEWGNPRGRIKEDSITIDEDGTVRLKPPVPEKAEDGYSEYNSLDDEDSPGRCRETVRSGENPVGIYAGVWLPFPGVTCAQLKETLDSRDWSEAEYAAWLIQQRGWGGFAGYVYEPPEDHISPCQQYHDQGIPMSVKPGSTTYSDTERTVRVNNEEQTLIDRSWVVTIEIRTAPYEEGFCPIKAKYETDDNGNVTAKIFAEAEIVIGEAQLGDDASTAEEDTASDFEWECQVEGIGVPFSQKSYVCELTLGTKPIEYTPEEAERLSTPEGRGWTDLSVDGVFRPDDGWWWNMDSESSEVPDGCGDPFHRSNSPPNDICADDTHIIWPWFMTGWNCPNPWYDQKYFERTLPSGHNFFPSSRLRQYPPNPATFNTRSDTDSPALTNPAAYSCGAASVENAVAHLPERSGRGGTLALDDTTEGGNILSEQHRPLLPSVAFPPVSDPSPHTHLGWSADVPDLLGSVTPAMWTRHYEDRQWTAGKEIALRSRWLSGGVQTEDDGTVHATDGNEREREYATQARISPHQICGAYPPLGDGCVFEGVSCQTAQLPPGGLCEQYLRMVARAAEDGIALVGTGHRTAQRQLSLRYSNCDTANSSLVEVFGGWLRCTPPTAPVGTSLHQYGYAIDFVDSHGASLTIESREFAWLHDHAWRWGFYNLVSEPWHWSTTGG